jgi:hypothetical protein
MAIAKNAACLTLRSSSDFFQDLKDRFTDTAIDDVGPDHGHSPTQHPNVLTSGVPHPDVLVVQRYADGSDELRVICKLSAHLGVEEGQRGDGHECGLKSLFSSVYNAKNRAYLSTTAYTLWFLLVPIWVMLGWRDRCNQEG